MRLLCLAVILMVLGGPLRAEWEVVGVDGQEYVTLGSVGANLGLSAPAVSGNEYSLTGSGGSLVVKGDSRQALIKGVRPWL